MPAAYISYSRQDAREFAVRMADALESRGLAPYVDLEDVPPASRWREELEQRIAASDSLVFVITPGTSRPNVFDPTGERIAVVGTGGTAMAVSRTPCSADVSELLPMATDIVPRELTDEERAQYLHE